MTLSLPTRALSIRQPWAWLIVNGLKDVENRDWRTSFRGPVLIHAGKRLEREAADDLRQNINPCSGTDFGWPSPDTYQLGGIVGVAEIGDCVTSFRSPWFVGEFGFVIRNARPLPFMPMPGKLGFFPATYEAPQ